MEQVDDRTSEVEEVMDYPINGKWNLSDISGVNTVREGFAAASSLSRPTDDESHCFLLL